MLHRLPSSVRTRFVAAALFLTVTAFVAARQPGGADPLFSVSMDDLDRDAARARKKGTELFLGTTTLDPKDETQKSAIDVAARYTLYRFYDLRAKEPSQVDKVFQEFEDQQLKPIFANKDKNTGVPQLYTSKMIEHAKLVLQTPRPIARVNTARVLARLTKLGQPELADALLQMLDQELQYDVKPGDQRRNDGVKLYLLRGLGEMLTMQEQTPPVLSKPQEEKIIVALVQFVERKAPLEKSATPDEIDGYRILRREAVRALANGRLASLPGNAKVRPGLVLLHVMAHDGLTPEPRMDERLEAAIGVARLNPELDKTYLQEYAAHQLGFFVQGLAAYTATKAKEEQKPVKVYAARLVDAMEGMKTGNKNEAVTKIVDQSMNVLKPVETSGAINPAAVTAFDQWLIGNPSKKTSLYEGVKDATVLPANRPEAEAPDKKDDGDK